MARAGYGAQAAQKNEKVRAVAHLKLSPMNERMLILKTKRSITKDEAAQILTSALFYCNQSGLTATFSEVDGRLTIFFVGLTVRQGADGRMAIVPRVPPVAADVPQSSTLTGD